MSSTKPALTELQSNDQESLLHAIDRLRTCGLTRELALPQLIVCGNQSAGKSSVLEAISHIKFPTAARGCKTTFASEIVLRRKPRTSVTASIQPSLNSIFPTAQDTELTKFQVTAKDLADFPRVLQSATEHMRAKMPGDWTFCKYRLRVEVCGPEQPHLTLVDLPGLVQCGNEADIEIVEDVIAAYMKQPNSIILAVMAAPDDLKTQRVFQLAQRYDLAGARTIGILTKPDLVKPGTEERVLRLARDDARERTHIKWHVLRNRNEKTVQAKDDSSEIRDSDELEFFSKAESPWKGLPQKICGIRTLRQRLSDLVQCTSSQSLPALITDTKKKVDSFDKTINALGEPRSTMTEKILFLTGISLRLSNLISQAMAGAYHDEFFDHESVLIPHRRFRTTLRNLETTFNDQMTTGGRQFHFIKDETDTSDCKIHRQKAVTDFSFTTLPKPICTDKATALKAMSNFMTLYKGRELDGEAPAGMVAKIFKIQSTPWETLAQQYVADCVKAASAFLQAAVHAVAPDYNANNIFHLMISKEVDRCSEAVHKKVAELVTPFQQGLPTTRNPGFYKRKREMDVKRREREGHKGSDVDTALAVLDDVECYYQIAQYTFVDNVITLATENCVVRPLEAVLDANKVRRLSSETLDSLASEPTHVISERADLIAKRATLSEVLQNCEALLKKSYGREDDHDTSYSTLTTKRDGILPSRDLSPGKAFTSSPAQASLSTPPRTPAPSSRSNSPFRGTNPFTVPSFVEFGQK